MSVSAVLVTRGDVPLDQIIDSITAAGIDDIVVWDNSVREDLAVYGRYAGIAEAKHDLIYVQDDDCVVPSESIKALIAEWADYRHSQYDFSHPDHKVLAEWAEDHFVANMPFDFRHSFYREHSLVGFGAVFHRDAPYRAHDRFNCRFWEMSDGYEQFFNRTCDVVFTALTPRVLVDVPYQNLAWAEGPDRMYRQPSHGFERARMLEWALKVRDG